VHGHRGSKYEYNNGTTSFSEILSIIMDINTYQAYLSIGDIFGFFENLNIPYCEVKMFTFSKKIKILFKTITLVFFCCIF
jgi:hypothetical protein